MRSRIKVRVCAPMCCFEKNKTNPKTHTRDTQFCSILLKKKKKKSFLPDACDLGRHHNIHKLVKISHENKLGVCGRTGAGDGEHKNWAFYDAPFCSNGNKAKLFFCFVVADLHGADTRWHLFRNPCSYTWKALALLFWNREINKCPSDWFRIKNKKKNTQQHNTRCACVCVRVHHCRHNMLYVISTQPPVYMKGGDKHHMNSNKAHPQSTNTSSSWS